MIVWQLIKNSQLDTKEAEMLLSFLVGRERSYILTHPEIGLDAETIHEFNLLEKKRLSGWSIAALTGQKEFYGLNFQVDKNVLIPRPETELMVEEILKLRIEKPLIIDVGTGSGAIIITIAKYAQLTGAQFLAIDISPLALKIARINARKLIPTGNIEFKRGDLLKPISKRLAEQNLIIAANLPYLTKTQIASSPSIQKEPKLALYGGPDGLSYYRQLFEQLKRCNYKSLHLFIEIDSSQTKAIQSLAKKYFLASSLEILKDLSGLNRLLIIKKPE